MSRRWSRGNERARWRRLWRTYCGSSTGRSHTTSSIRRTTRRRGPPNRLVGPRVEPWESPTGTSNTIFKSGRVYSQPASTSVGCSGGVWHGESEGNAESFRDRPGADRPGRQEVELGLRAPRGLEEPAPRAHGALPREDGQRKGEGLHRLPRAIQRCNRTLQGRHPVPLERVAGRGPGPVVLDDLEVRGHGHPLRRRERRGDLQSERDVEGRARA